jgi:AcrR family transcriptional regulator
MSSEPIWARPEPGARRPRFTREQIAQEALAIADAEGIEAVSMRRVAARLEAGTMTLYHYIRTKDELLALLDDAIMAELLVPDDELPGTWREALAAIARQTHDAIRRHPWALEGLRGARVGPNGMKHVEQSLAAVSRLDLEPQERLELIGLIDDYVVGYAVRDGAGRVKHADESAELDAISGYVAQYLATGEYPHMQELLGGASVRDAFEHLGAVFRDDSRFERGLERLLDGIERDLRGRSRRRR